MHSLCENSRLRRIRNRLTGSSDSSVHRLNNEHLLDGPMVQRSDDPIVASLAMYQKNKRLAIYRSSEQKPMSMKIRHFGCFSMAGAPSFPTMCQKQKGLAMHNKNPSKSYVIEINKVILFSASRLQKNAGGKNEG